MNEGHAAFLTLELIREKMAAGKNYSDALAETKAQCHFTTHTPVEAGHDRFTPELMDYALQSYRALLSVPWPDVMGLGRVNPEDANESFCMTVLALKVSRAANGVSELHGQVSRQMWQILYPDTPVEKVPIGHITNGIHLLGWMKGTVRQFWRKKLTNGGDGACRRCGMKNSAHDWAAAVNSLRILGKNGRPGICFRRGTLGVALQIAPRTD